MLVCQQILALASTVAPLRHFHYVTNMDFVEDMNTMFLDHFDCMNSEHTSRTYALKVFSTEVCNSEAPYF